MFCCELLLEDGKLAEDCQKSAIYLSQNLSLIKFLS